MRRARAVVLIGLLLVTGLARSAVSVEQPRVDPDRVKAVFSDAIPSGIESWATTQGATVILRSDPIRLVVFQALAGTTGATLLSQLRSRSDVDVASYDIGLSAQHSRTAITPNPPNDPRWSDQYGPALIGIGSGSTNDLWVSEAGSHDVRVAILDTGVDQTHQDLDQACSPGCSASETDVHSHGTHVAGIVAAGINNSLGIAGLASVKLRSKKVLNANGEGFTSEVAAAIVQAVAEDVDVINMSLGGPCMVPQGVDAVQQYACYDEEAAVALADAAGVVMVAAAGNEGCLGASESCILYPARYPQVLAAGSVAQNKGWAGSSSGEELDLVAPGSQILSTCPLWKCAGGYRYMSGSSMATPHVSAVAALLQSHCSPRLTKTEVEQTLIQSAEDLGLPGHDVDFGYGMVRAAFALEYAHQAFGDRC